MSSSSCLGTGIDANRSFKKPRLEEYPNSVLPRRYHYREIILDSSVRNIGSKSATDYTFTLPEDLIVRNVMIKRAVIPYIFNTIEKNVNDKLYFRVSHVPYKSQTTTNGVAGDEEDIDFSMSNVSDEFIYYRIIIPPGNYTIDKLCHRTNGVINDKNKVKYQVWDTTDSKWDDVSVINIPSVQIQFNYDSSTNKIQMHHAIFRVTQRADDLITYPKIPYFMMHRVMCVNLRRRVRLCMMV
jgi:hypothetical protein